MTDPQVVSREEWLAERLKLLEQEKDTMRAQDAANARRAALPLVRIEKDYVFEGPDGTARLVDMFEGRRQHNRARFPRAAGQDREVPARMGWTIPWYSSAGSDFNILDAELFELCGLPRALDLRPDG